MSKKIKICPTCKGYGYLAQGVDYHPRSGYDSWEKVECTDCKGTGRIVKIVKRDFTNTSKITKKYTKEVTRRAFNSDKDLDINNFVQAT